MLKYGSDPLKTYLPDSDIDITVIPMEMEPSESSLAQLKTIKNEFDTYKEKQWEEREDFPSGISSADSDIGLKIKNIVLIDQADVEIIKLNIGNTLVDISIK